MKNDEQEILTKLSTRTIEYFLNDLGLEDITNDIKIEDVSKVDYEDITTFISLNGSLSGTIGMSVSNDLAFKMVESFIFGDTDEQELQELSAENIAETLNITLGNILSLLSIVQNGGNINISTPYTMHNKVTITKKTDGMMLLSKLMYNGNNILLTYFK